MTSGIPRLLCISLSPLRRDARVLRQLSVLQEFGDVTTIGYGPSPDGVARHIRVPDHLKTLPQTPLGVARLATRQLRRSELAAPAIGFALDALRDEAFDLVVSNDARVLALAFAVAGEAPVWSDLHEWAPEERTHILSWRLLVAPLMDHLCRGYLPRAAAVTTVGDEIAGLYRERYGVRAEVMRNSAPFADLRPSEVEAGRIRLVHSGGAVHGRNLEATIDAMRALDDRFTLDFYLVPAADGGRYLEQLRRRAAGTDRIRFRDPVEPHLLAKTLNAYDVGVFWIPPVHTNARLTLPNKLFDYVQARLALAIGPTIEMERVVNDYGLGVVSTSFSLDDCVASLSALTPESIAAFKAKSNAAARELSFDRDRRVARDIVSRLLERS